MKIITINNNNLTDNDISYEVNRVKGLLVNSNDDLLLCHNNNTFQFLGGHVDSDEELHISLKRELMEEAGISDVNIRNPFLKIITYDDNYFNSGKVVKNIIHYFKVETDEKPNMEKTKYDMIESRTPFYLYYIKDYELERFIIQEEQKDNIDNCIAKEMLLAAGVYNNIYKGDEVI